MKLRRPKGVGDRVAKSERKNACHAIESVLAILDDWNDWTNGEEDEDGREDLARIRRMKCHLRGILKGLELR
jgi:hypothetical protein